MRYCACGCGSSLDGPVGQRFLNKTHKDKAYRRRKSGGTETQPVDHGKHAERVRIIEKLLIDNGVDVDDIGSVKAVKLNEYQNFYAEVVSCEACHGTGGTDDAICQVCNGKTTKRVPRVIDMKAASLILHPTWAEGPKWPVVQPVPPVTIKPFGGAKKNSSNQSSGWFRAIILPDPQVGFRRDLETGELDPFHDEDAISVANQILADVQPDLVIYLGDCLDFASFGNFQQEPGFALTVQPALNYLHRWFAGVRATLPNADIRWLEGNHEKRLQNAIINNALAAFGLKRANLPESWPVMSMQNLLRLDELGITYIPGYPAGETEINDNLTCIHGIKVKSNSSTAWTVADDERISTIFGHTHRAEINYRTRKGRGEPKFNMAASPGTLARLDGATPSTNAGLNQSGQSIKAYKENWQQAIGIVDYEEGDGRFTYQNVMIFNGYARYGGKSYQA